MASAFGGGTNLRVGIDASGAVVGAGLYKRSAFDIARSSARATTGVNVLDSSMKRLRLSTLALGLSLKTLTFGYLFFKGIKVVAQFQHEMANVKAVTQTLPKEFETVEEHVKRSGIEMARMTEVARELGATTIYTATQAAEGMKYLGLAGFKTHEILAAIGPTLDLAVAATINLGQSADLTSNIMQAFGYDTDQARRVVDVLALTASQSNTNVLQLAEAMKLAGPISGALGLQIEDTSAAIGVLGNAGIQASLAGTALRIVFSSLLDPVNEARQEIEGLGISLADVNPRTRTLLEIFQEFSSKDLGAGGAVRIFQRRGAAAALAMINALDDMEELRVELGRANGAAEKMALTIQDTLFSAFKRFTSAVQEAALIVGDSWVGTGIRSLVEGTTAAIRVLIGFEEHLDEGVLQSAKRAAEAIKLLGKAFIYLISLKVAGWAYAVGASFLLLAGRAIAVYKAAGLAVLVMGRLQGAALLVSAKFAAVAVVATILYKVATGGFKAAKSTEDWAKEVEAVTGEYKKFSYLKVEKVYRGISQEVYKLGNEIDKLREKQIAFADVPSSQLGLGIFSSNVVAPGEEDSPAVKENVQQLKALQAQQLKLLASSTELAAVRKINAAINEQDAAALGRINDKMSDMWEEILRLTGAYKGYDKEVVQLAQSLGIMELGYVKIQRAEEAMARDDIQLGKTRDLQEYLNEVEGLTDAQKDAHKVLQNLKDMYEELKDVRVASAAQESISEMNQEIKILSGTFGDIEPEFLKMAAGLGLLEKSLKRSEHSTVDLKLVFGQLHEVWTQLEAALGEVDAKTGLDKLFEGVDESVSDMNIQMGILNGKFGDADPNILRAAHSLGLLGLEADGGEEALKRFVKVSEDLQAAMGKVATDNAIAKSMKDMKTEIKILEGGFGDFNTEALKAAAALGMLESGITFTADGAAVASDTLKAFLAAFKRLGELTGEDEGATKAAQALKSISDSLAEATLRTDIMNGKWAGYSPAVMDAAIASGALALSTDDLNNSLVDLKSIAEVNRMWEVYTAAIESTNTPLDTFKQQQSDLDQLLSDQVITQAEYTAQLKLFKQEYQDTTNSARETEQVIRQGAQAIGTALENIIIGAGSAKESIIRLVAEIVKMMAIRAIMSFLMPTPAAHGVSVEMGGQSNFDASGIAAHGASFSAPHGAAGYVRGKSGARDSKLLSIMASPGERVEVTPPGVRGSHDKGGSNVSLQIITPPNTRAEVQENTSDSGTKLRVAIRQVVINDLKENGAITRELTRATGARRRSSPA